MKPEKGLPSAWWAASGRPLCVWSTYRLERGQILASHSLRLFTVPLGHSGQGFSGRALDRADTNITEWGSVGGRQAFVIHTITWIPLWDGDEDLTPVEQLARVGYAGEASGYNRLWHHASLTWEVGQMQFPVAPVSTRSVPVLISVSPTDQFSLLLRFGTDTPPVPEGCRLRAVLSGLAVDEADVSETLASFSACYRTGQLPLLGASGWESS